MKRKPANPSKSAAEDRRWMARALELAWRGRYAVSPNPMVGACLVKQGKLLAEGWHEIYGGDHAEVHALKKAGRRARGAVLYVTLEPCSSWGKTPPCVEAIMTSGVRRVVIGSFDPNPVHGGRGIKKLRQAGLQVKAGVLSQETAAQNESFFKHIKTKKPFVTLKMAQSLDGKIATREGHARWISSKPARLFVHQLRAEQDAVLVGTRTLHKDNPLLSPRMRPVKGRETKPWRVVLDPRFEISPKARVFQGKQLTVIAVSEKLIQSKAVQRKEIPSAVLLPVAEKKGKLDLSDLLKKLGSLGVSKLLVEGGGELAWSFVNEKLADKIYWITAPKFIGGRNAKTSLEGEGVALASDAVAVKNVKVSQLGPDFLFEGTL